jgi:hypothetical protein
MSRNINYCACGIEIWQDQELCTHCKALNLKDKNDMTSYYYVYRVGNRAPTIKHPTLASAANEAERLANQHPGDTFEILQCLAITRTVMAKTFWLDGVTPPTSV